MARRRKKRKLNLRLLAIVLIVLIVFLLGLGRYIKTPQGKAFLLDIGFGGRFSEVQGSIGEAVMRTLHEFDAYAIKEKRVGHPLRKVQIVSIEARVPADISLIQLNLAVTEAAGRMGGRVTSASEIPRDRGLKLEIGTRRYVTHRVKIVRGRRTLAPVKERIKEPLVAVIVDDFGYFDNSLVRGFLEFDAPITITIIPGLEFSKRIAGEAEAAGREFLCHMPMEPVNGGYGDVPMVRTGMDTREIEKFVLKALEDVPGAVGMNNHMGSKATADERVMRRVLSICRKKGLFFVDSMTSPKSAAYRVARKLGVPCVRNDLFLDNRDEETRSAMRRLVRIAKRRGYSVGIMHVKRKSLEDLRWFKDEVEREGVKMINVSKLIEIVSDEKEE